MKYIDSKEFLEKSESIPVVDVRSPGEYIKGHIPGAVNIPLFSDDERAKIGTLYKRKGRKESIKKGLEFIGPRMAEIIEETESLSSKGKLLVHCWRGGMRSESMAWLFERVDIDCELLSGGYKSYRKFIRETILEGREILILGGFTGSGKTNLLREMRELGEPVIDLEGLASHRGSAFGGIGLKDQPNTEQFENNLFAEINKLNENYFWVEDESLQIGKVFIPEPFFQRMMQSKVLFIDVPFEYRIQVLVKEYAKQDVALLEEAIYKLEQRLGNQDTSQAVDFLRQGEFHQTARILLAYYDKTYKYGLDRKNPENVNHLNLSDVSPDEYSRLIIEKKYDLLRKKNSPIQ